MGLLDREESQGIPDAFGVPVYYATKFFAEPAGPSEIRLYACTEMNGILVPQYIGVYLVESVLKGTVLMRELALKILRGGNAVH